MCWIMCNGGCHLTIPAFGLFFNIRTPFTCILVMCMYSYPLDIAHMHTMVTEKQTKQRRGKVH